MTNAKEQGRWDDNNLEQARTKMEAEKELLDTAKDDVQTGLGWQEGQEQEPWSNQADPTDEPWSNQGGENPENIVEEQEEEPVEKWDKDDDIGRNYAEPTGDDEPLDDDSYWQGRMEEAEEENKCEGCGKAEDFLNDDSLCEDCEREAGIDRKQSERDAYEDAPDDIDPIFGKAEEDETAYDDMKYKKDTLDKLEPYTLGEHPKQGFGYQKGEEDSTISVSGPPAGTQPPANMFDDEEDEDKLLGEAGTNPEESWNLLSDYEKEGKFGDWLSSYSDDESQFAQYNYGKVPYDQLPSGFKSKLGEGIPYSALEDEMKFSQKCYDWEGHETDCETGEIIGQGYSQSKAYQKFLNEARANENGWWECPSCGNIAVKDEDKEKHEAETGHNMEHAGFQPVIPSFKYGDVREALAWEFLSRDLKLKLSEGFTPTTESEWNTSTHKQRKEILAEAGMYGFGSATGRMPPRDSWEQGYSPSGVNPVFQEFRTLHWSELPSDIQELWKSEMEYLTTGEVSKEEIPLLSRLLDNELEEEEEGHDETEDIALVTQLLAPESDFKEEEHPREEGGKFTSGGGAGKKADKPKTKPHKAFDKAKTRAMRGMTKPDASDTYQTNKYNQVNNLDGFPTHSSQLRGAGVSIKAPIMKAHLQTEYPNNKWSVRTEYFSMGSAIDAHWKGDGGYPYGASDQVAELYSNSGASNMQVDYSDTDNYVHLYDGRKDADPRDPQTLAKSRAERLQGWIRDDLGNLDYNDRINWSVGTAKNFIEKGEFTSWVGMTDEHKERINQTWKEFQEQEKKEGGTGEAPKESPKASTPAFHTQQYMADDPSKPTEIPIDPETGKELPVSKYNPRKGEYPVSDPTTETPADVDRAHKQMLAQKAELDKPQTGSTFDQRGKAYQRKGEAYDDSDRAVSPNALNRYTEPIDLPNGKNALDQTYGVTEPEYEGQDLTGKTIGEEDAEYDRIRNLMDMMETPETPEDLDRWASKWGVSEDLVEKVWIQEFGGRFEGEAIKEKKPFKPTYLYYKQYPFGRRAGKQNPFGEANEGIYEDIKEQIKNSGISYGYNRDELINYLKSSGYYDEDILDAFNRYYGEATEQVSIDTMNQAHIWWDNKYPERQWSDMRIGERQNAILAFLRDPTTSLEAKATERDIGWTNKQVMDQAWDIMAQEEFGKSVSQLTNAQYQWIEDLMNDYGNTINPADKPSSEAKEQLEDPTPWASLAHLAGTTVKDILFPSEEQAGGGGAGGAGGAGGSGGAGAGGSGGNGAGAPTGNGGESPTVDGNGEDEEEPSRRRGFFGYGRYRNCPKGQVYKNGKCVDKAEELSLSDMTEEEMEELGKKESTPEQAEEEKDYNYYCPECEMGFDWEQDKYEHMDKEHGINVESYSGEEEDFDLSDWNPKTLKDKILGPSILPGADWVTKKITGEGGKGSGKKDHKGWMIAIEEDHTYDFCENCSMITEQVNHKCEMCGKRVE